MINELKMGLRPTKVIEKPYILILLERCERWHTTPVSGGIIDQPYLLMLELETAIAIRDVMASLPRPGGQT